MPLERRHIRNLLSTVSRTREEHVDCGECLASMAEFAELQLVGAELPEALHLIQEHLEICPECTEEYEVLLDVMRAAASEPLT